MNRKWLLAFLFTLTMSTGCIIKGGGGGPLPVAGDVTFSWTFYGSSTCPAAVQSVHVVIPGEVLQNDGYYSCTANGYSGIVLHAFNPKSYAFTLEALDASGNALYTGTGTFVVNGNVLVNVDLTPTGRPSSWAYLLWTFPAGTNLKCNSGISFVDVQIDGATATRYNCTEGLSNPGATTPLIAPGNHTISLWAIDNTGYVYYSAQSTLTTSPNSQVQQAYSLQWAVGGTALTTQFTDGSTGVSCQNSGVTTLIATFKNTQTGTVLYGTLNDPSSWSAIANVCNYTYVTWPYLPPGQYYVYFRAYNASGVTYDSNFTTPPTVTITAGVFPGEADAQSHRVTMYRVQ